MSKMDFSIKWKEAFLQGKRVLKDPSKTQYVIALAYALNGPALKKSYDKLLTTEKGTEIALAQPEFVELHSQLESCPKGSVGEAILKNQTYSLAILNKISQRGKRGRSWINSNHPYIWMARRYRDTHDVFHTITGYKMDIFGEAALTTFTYAQTGALQWGFLIIVGLVKLRFHPLKILAMIEAFYRGKKCAWLLAEDYEKLIHEDLEECRSRLNLPKARIYNRLIKNSG